MAEERRESAERAFQAYCRTLDTVTPFKYLGCILTALDDDFPEVVVGLWKAWKSWARLLRIMVREGASNRVPGMLFNVVVQAVMILGVETWVINPHIGQAPVRGYNAGLRNVSRGGSPSGYWMGSGTNLLWRQRCRNRGSKRWGGICLRGIIRS